MNYTVLMSEAFIRNNWESIQRDAYNNRPDISTAGEYISEAKAGRVKAGGARVVISEGMPEFVGKGQVGASITHIGQ